MVLIMGTFIDTTGQRFGSLVVIEDKPGRASGETNPHIKCRCDCGNIAWVQKGSVKAGRTSSCGCGNDKKDLTGRTSSTATVIDDNGLELTCRCNCGNLFHIKRGYVTRMGSCGEHKKKRIGTLVEVYGVSMNLADWGCVIGFSRERARYLHAKGRLVERVKDFIGSPRAKTKR